MFANDATKYALIRTNYYNGRVRIKLLRRVSRFGSSGYQSYSNHVQMKTIPKFIDNLEPLVSTSTVAAHFGVHDGTIRRLRREGMPSYPFGPKMVRYKLSEVQAWLNQRSASKPAPVINTSGLRGNQPVAA
jgi:predicted DNA-binding transcriptional regulator AlpA